MNIFHSILSGYVRTLSIIAKILLLLLFCGIFGFCVVFPLWKWAVLSPHTYTVAVLAVAAGVLMLAVVRSVKRSVFLECTSLPEIKSRIRGVLCKFLQLSVVVIAVLAAIGCVMTGHRVVALAVLVAGSVICGIFAFLMKNR